MYFKRTWPTLSLGWDAVPLLMQYVQSLSFAAFWLMKKQLHRLSRAMVTSPPMLTHRPTIQRGYSGAADLPTPIFWLNLIHRSEPYSTLCLSSLPICPCTSTLMLNTSVSHHRPEIAGAGQGETHTAAKTKQVVCWQTPHVFENWNTPLASC